MLKITEEAVNPFVRCVGRGTGLYQTARYCAYDYRLVYIADGCGEVVCGEEICTAEVGDLFIFAPGTPFSVRCSPVQTCFVVNFDWTQNRADVCSPVLSVEEECFVAENVLEKAELSALDCGNEAIVLKGFFEAEELLRALYKVYFTGVRPNQIQLSGLLKELIGLLVDRVRRSQEKNEKSFLLANRVMTYVQENYEQKITLETAAAALHYHPTYINRSMKAAAGVSFHQHLINYRLRQALQLLEAKGMTMEEIAVKTGFSNSKHFSTCFKNHFGISPSKYVLCQI